MASPTCFFNCGNSDKKLVCGGKNRIETIINSSIQRHDLYHIDLQSMLDNNPNVTIHFHNACVTTYNSKIHMNRYQKKNSSLDTSSQQTPPKQLRCHYSFNFREHCLICGDLCLEKSAKNPGRHKKVVRCRTVHIKDNLIKVCEQRGDSHAVEVSSRITCAITDLHAADARYHQTCFTTFVSSRNIAAAVASTSKQQKPDPVNLAFSCVIRLLKSDPGKLWNSVELYDVYSQSLKAAEGFEYGDEGQNNADANNTGQRCARSSLIQRLQEHFGECLIVLRTEGCANIIAFRKHVSEKLKLVEANDDDNISDLANNITLDVKTRSPKYTDTYHLKDFTFEKAKENCNESLLAFISKLISKGSITKKSVCLTMSIQALITKSFNQVTLGYAVKIHHEHGSRAVIDLLYNCGYVASYDEVRRYRKSAAKLTGEQDFTFRGLFNDGGLISSWCDNFDLQVYTPNGCRETHSMAIEFTQHVNSK